MPDFFSDLDQSNISLWISWHVFMEGGTPFMVVGAGIAVSWIVATLFMGKSMGMESRGFSRTKRTFCKEYPISLLEYEGMGVALGLLVVYGVWVKDLSGG